jgi:hypothetical protein
MREEGVKFEEIETSYTLGGYRRCRCDSTVRYHVVHRSVRICYHKDKGLVLKKNHVPVSMWEWGEWGWGGYWYEIYSVVRYTIVNRSHRTFWQKVKGMVSKKPHGPVWMWERDYEDGRGHPVILQTWKSPGPVVGAKDPTKILIFLYFFL